MAGGTVDSFDKLAEALKKVEGVDTEALEDFRKQLVETDKEARRTSRSVSRFSSDMSGIAQAALQSRDALRVQMQGVKGTSDAMNDLLRVTADIPGIGSALKPVLKIAEMFNTGFTAAVEKAIKGGQAIMQTFEGPIAPIRAMEKELFNVEKRFGGTYESARQFGVELLRMTSSAGMEFFVTPEDLTAMRNGFAQNNVAIQKFRGTVETALGPMDKLAFATLHASSVGLSMGEYAQYTSRAMRDQGKSFEEASLQIQMFSDVAENTGLSVNSIADALGRGVQQFEKLGFASDFGRTFIEGFTRSLDDLGLGFGQALDLASSLTHALAKVTENYGTAFITMQRGGLDFGGGGASGGVLGAGIEYQAAVLEAEQTGDQAEMGNLMAGAMRDTIASFTGGQIVTVSEAAEGGAQQKQAFFTQQKLLQDMYGLDQQSSTRTLELLKNLDEASSSGNRDLVDSLNQQLSEEVKGRDKTLTEQEKTNAQLSAISALNLVRNRVMLEQLAQGAATGRRIAVEAGGVGQQMAFKQMEAGLGAASRLVQGTESFVTDMIGEIGNIASVSDKGNAQEEAARQARFEAMKGPMSPDSRIPGAVDAGIATNEAQEAEKQRGERNTAERVEVTSYVTIVPTRGAENLIEIVGTANETRTTGVN